MYEFYSNEMTSKAVINARSAFSWSTKRTVLTREVLRVLLNCSKLLPWERVVENVNEMVLRMQYSGYSEKFRYKVVNSALKAYETRKKGDQEGERPLHRPRERKREERDQEKNEEEKQLVQERRKRGGNLCTSYTEFTATEETPERKQRHVLRA